MEERSGTRLAEGMPCGQSRTKTKETSTQDHEMNALEMKGNWNIIKGKLKQKYAQLTDNDLQYVSGKEDELIGRIQKRTGQTKEEVERELDECTSCCDKQ